MSRYVALVRVLYIYKWLMEARRIIWDGHVARIRIKNSFKSLVKSGRLECGGHVFGIGKTRFRNFLFMKGINAG